MGGPIKATEASRRFSAVLDRVCFGGEAFDVVRNGVVVGRIVPPEAKRATLRDLLRLLRDLRSPDAGFGEDLEALRADQPPLDEEPWPP